MDFYDVFSQKFDIGVLPIARYTSIFFEVDVPKCQMGFYLGWFHCLKTRKNTKRIDQIHYNCTFSFDPSKIRSPIKIDQVYLLANGTLIILGQLLSQDLLSNVDNF